LEQPSYTDFNKRHMAVTFESVLVRTLSYLRVVYGAIISTIRTMIVHAPCHKIIFAVLDVLFGF